MGVAPDTGIASIQCGSARPIAAYAAASASRSSSKCASLTGVAERHQPHLAPQAGYGIAGLCAGRGDRGDLGPGWRGLLGTQEDRDAREFPTGADAPRNCRAPRPTRSRAPSRDGRAPGPTRWMPSSIITPSTLIESRVSPSTLPSATAGRTAAAVPGRPRRRPSCRRAEPTRRVSTLMCGARRPVPTSQPPACSIQSPRRACASSCSSTTRIRSADHSDADAGSMTTGRRQPHVATSPGRGPNRRSTPRVRPHDRERSAHSRCHRPAVTRRDDARNHRSLANPTRSTPRPANAPASQIVTTNRPTTSPLATADDAGRDRPGRGSGGRNATTDPTTPASFTSSVNRTSGPRGSASSRSGPTGAIRATGGVGRTWSTGTATADTTPTASTQCLAVAELLRRRRLPISARSRIADTLRVNTARGPSRFLPLQLVSFPFGPLPRDAPADRPALCCAALAFETTRAIRSSSGSVRRLASPPSNAATARSADPAPCASGKATGAAAASRAGQSPRKPG